MMKGRSEWPTTRKAVDPALLEAAANRPVLQTEKIPHPVVIESIEVLEQGDYYFIRTRSTDGVVGTSVATYKMGYLYPLHEKRLAHLFIGKDARDLEQLIEAAYVWKSNYKLSGLALWCCVAWIEISILDLLGKVAGLPLGELLGGIVRREVPIYAASGNRDTTPQEEVEILQGRIAATGAKAVKYKVGGRMSKDADSMEGRSEGLITRSRRVLGDGIDILADANGSYSPERAVLIGRRLEEIDAYFFEEPCPFDHLEETKAVADALQIPITGGEQETSQRRFRWMLENDAVQVVQPDIQYYGGFIRTIRVARMAELAGVQTTVHIAQEPGFIYTLHFASCVPNVGRYQEYKGHKTLGPLLDPALECKDGIVAVPTKPGLGFVHIDEHLKGAERIAYNA